MEKKILIVASIFIIGFIVGIISAAIYSGNMIIKTGDISTLLYITDLENRTFQAYKNEKPEIGIWALKNLAQVLEKNPQIKSTQIDLALTYGRLAIKLKTIGDMSGYEKNINKAISIFQQASPEEKHTKANIIDFFNKIDEVKKKTHNLTAGFGD